jgi:hypothetical protein
LAKRRGIAREIPPCRRGDKSKYTHKQHPKADHIAKSDEKKGVSDKDAERRA